MKPFTLLVMCWLVLLGRDASARVPDYCYKVSIPKEVIAGCTRFLDIAKTSKDKNIALNRRGRAHYDNGDYEKALRDFDDAMKVAPDRDSRLITLLYRGDAWYRQGNQDRAIAEYSEMIRIDPTFGAAFANRGLALKEKGDIDRAIADYDKAMLLLPKLAGLVLNNRGHALIEKGEYDRAIADFDRAIRLMPKESRLYAHRGHAWRMKGNLERALQDHDKSILLGGTRALMEYTTRGDTYRYAGNLSNALADYEKALQNTKDYPPALTGLGLTYEKLGDLPKAKEHFERSIGSASANNAYDLSRSAIETARARIAALDSGVTPPVIPSAPMKATNAHSVPTPELHAPIVSRPLPPERVQTAVAKSGRRVALVVGNSRYAKVSELKNPENDSAAVAAALRNIGFDLVVTASDASKQKLNEVVQAFAREADRADWAMVYYAGHGIEVNGQNYLIPVDATLKTDRDVQFEAIPLDHVMAAIDGSRKIKLVVLDACRDNPFAPKIEKTGAREVVAQNSTSGGAIGTRSVGRGLGEVKVSGASLIVFAAKHGQTALDGEGANSPFAIALVQRMATPGVEINKIFRLVRDDVMEATAGRQEPYTYGSLPGREDFYFTVK